MESRKERVKAWASLLGEDEKVKLLVDLALDSVCTETVSFPEGALAPYWSATGEPLVEGQDCWPDDE